MVSGFLFRSAWRGIALERDAREWQAVGAWQHRCGRGLSDFRSKPQQAEQLVVDQRDTQESWSRLISTFSDFIYTKMHVRSRAEAVAHYMSKRP